MASTTRADVFVPEIATEIATAEFPNKLALGVAGAPFVRGFPPEDQLGDEGDIIKFPRWQPLGDFAALTEDVAMTPEKLQTAQDVAVVQVAGKAVEITDWASLASRGDPSQETGIQIATLAARYVDAALVTEAETTPLESDVSGGAQFTWNGFVDAIVGKWGDKAMDNIGGIVVHSKQMGDIMQLSEFKDSSALGMPGTIITGFIGNLARYPVYVSDRLTTGAGPTYTALILKAGALGLKFQRTLLVEQDRDILKKNDVIAADVRFSTHLLWGDPYPAIKFITD